MSTPIAAAEPDEPAGGEIGLPSDWRDLSPEAKKVLLHKLRGRHVSLGLGGPRGWRSQARPKQLPPNDPLHHLPDENGYRCGCDGPDEAWNIWMFMAGRGCGKTWAGSNWIIEQALRDPGSMWAVVAPTFRDVRVTCFEGPSGIRRQLEPGEEAQWRRNELRLDLVNGSILYGYSADQPERLRGSNLSGAWTDEMGCLPGGTLISTKRGDVCISDVRAGDLVWTRSGLRAVRWAGETRLNADIWQIITADGKKLRCTPDHKIWTQNGWTEAQNVAPGAILVSWKHLSSSWDRQPGLNGTVSAGTGSTRTAALAEGITEIPEEISCTRWYGSGRMDHFLQESFSTIKTTTRRTTTSTTSNLSVFPSTAKSTQRNGSILTGRRTALARLLKNELSGSGQIVNRETSYAHGASKYSSLLECEPSTVVRSAVHENVVLVSEKLPYREAVTYDLTVDEDPEFFANGILVHNSWQYEETWYEGLVPALRIGEHPRVMVTSTPRPTHLIRDLFGRRDGTVHVTSASTYENSKNLSAAALDELRRRYEGTRLGRQELEGVLLDDLEGALWKRSDIDAARVKLADVPPLVRIVVGIDPAVTSGEESDETGIIVAGDDGRGHGYILGDYSMKGTPDQCMREAVKAYKRHGADCIVAEVNNGGDFIGTVLRAVDPDIPYRTVRASRGKAIRAEPVSAMAEQRRLHHVGSFPDLEDQMCSLVPGISAGPDDRVDACVWAVFELRGLNQASWLSAYGVARCRGCDHAYSVGLKECPRCRLENPLEAGRTVVQGEIVEDAAAEEDAPQPGGWAYVYGIKRCPRGHAYSDRNGNAGVCPRCRAGGLAFLQSARKGLTQGGGSGMIPM